MPQLKLAQRLRAAWQTARAYQPALQPAQRVKGLGPHRWVPAPRLVPLVQRWDHDTEMWVQVGPWVRLELLPEQRDEKLS